MILDELKLLSDDAVFTQEHVIWLASKYRSMLLKQHYKDIKKDIPESNYQTICLDLKKVEAIDGFPCEEGYMLKSVQEIPASITTASTKVYPLNFFKGERIAYVTMDRMKFVGHNRWTKNIIYAALGPDNHLWLTGQNPQYLYMKKAKVTAIFDDPEAAADLLCDENGKHCDILDSPFPIESALLPTLIELCVKELSGSVYRPEDTANNANDDFGSMSAPQQTEQ
jgi:hypothetical protein